MMTTLPAWNKQPETAGRAAAELLSAAGAALWGQSGAAEYCHAAVFAGAEQTGAACDWYGQQRRHGPNGHKIVVHNGEWIDAQTGQLIR